MPEAAVVTTSKRLAAPAADQYGRVEGVFNDVLEPEDLPEEPTTESPFVNPVPTPGAESLPDPASVRGVERPLPSGETLPADATAQSAESYVAPEPTNPNAEGEQIEDASHPDAKPDEE